MLAASPVRMFLHRMGSSRRIVYPHSTSFILYSTQTAFNYHRVADECLDHLLDYCETLHEQQDIPGFDVTLASGVLTLKLGPKGTFVLNKQPPNKQIWLSSPISGPKRFDYDVAIKKWLSTRERAELSQFFEKEVQSLLYCK